MDIISNMTPESRIFNSFKDCLSWIKTEHKRH